MFIYLKGEETMKKWISILMAVVLLVSCMATPVFANNSDVNINDEAAEIQADEEISELEAEKRAQMARKEFASIDRALRLNDEKGEKAEMSLFASNYTVSGTVSLPDGVTASNGDIIRVYAYEPVEKYNGLVVGDGSRSSIKSAQIDLSAGQTSGTYQMSLPEGEYTFAVRYLTGSKDISGIMHYYTANGVTANEYAADVVSVSSSVSGINLKLLKAKSYISGTIDLSKNIPQKDTYIGLSLGTNTSKLWINQYVYIPVSKGATSASYEIGVDKESFSIYVNYGGFFQGYYSSGTVKTGWKYRSMIDVTNPVENFNFSIPVSTTASSAGCDITVNLAKPVEEYKYMLVALADANGDVYDTEWIDVFEGESSFPCSFNPIDNDNLFLYYKDITGFDSYSYGFDESCRFYSAELGYTSDVNKATNIAGMKSITITEPESVTVSGNISTTGGSTARSYIYVGVEFEDEVFYTRANVASGTYSINVPKRMLNKEFKAFTAGGTYATLDSYSKKYAGTYTLTSDLNNINVGVSGFREISGTIYLPSAAPSIGMNISLLYEYDGENDWVRQEIGTIVVPAGAESVEYCVAVPFDAPEDGSIEASIEVFEKFNISSTAYSVSLTETEDIYFDNTVIVSGTVSLPDETVFDEDLTIQVCGYANSYEYTYITIPAGQSSAKYELSFSKDCYLNYLEVRLETKGLDFFEEIYYGADGKMSVNYVEPDIYTDKDATADFTLMKANFIKGSIYLPADVSYKNGEIGYRIICQEVNTGIDYRKNYYTSTPYTEKAFEIPVSTDASAEYILSVYVFQIGNSDIAERIYSYYVSDTKMTADQDFATHVTAGNSYKLTFPTSATLSGTISFDEGSFVKGGYLYGNVYAISKSTGETYRYYIEDFTDIKDIDYRIQIPDDASATYQIYAIIRNWNCEITNVSSDPYYYSVNGAVLSQDDATPVSKGTGYDIKIPKMRSISGKVIVPNDFKQIAPMGEVSAYLYSENGGTEYLDAYVDENLNYSVYIGDDVTGSYYIELYLGDKAVNNILSGYYSNSNDAEGADVYFDVPQGEDVTGINIYAKTGWAVSGTIKLPDDAVLNGVTINPRINYKDCLTQLTNTTRSVDYMLGVESQDYFKLCANCNSGSTSGESYTNLYRDDVYHVSNTKSTTNYNDAKNLTVNSDMAGMDIILQTGATFNIKAIKPSSVYEYIRFYVYLVDEDGNNIDNKSFYIYEDESSATETIVIDKEFIGKNVYMYYEIDESYHSDALYNYRLYVNPDGSYAHSRKDAKPFVIEEDITANFTLAKADVETPQYVLESAHPYANNIVEKEYTYKHPDETAARLYVTFSENTYFEWNDYIKIYDASGNVVYDDEYIYGDLSGKTIIVHGNSFTIELTTDDDGNAYGFAIESVTSKLEHTVTFKNYDGTVLGTKVVEHGAYVNYDGETPTKPDDDMYTYSFNGWEGNYYNVTSNVTLTAKYYPQPKYEVYINSDYTGYAYEIYNNTSSNVNAVLVIASYDISGKLIEAKTENLSFGYNAYSKFDIEKAENGTIKLMLFSSLNSLKPIAKSTYISY